MKKIEKVWESWATPRFGTLALLLKCVDNPKVWDVDVVFFLCRMMWDEKGTNIGLQWGMGCWKMFSFLEKKDDTQNLWVCCLHCSMVQWTLLRASHDGEVLIASVHFNPQSVEKATSVAQLHSESWLVVASGSIAAEHSPSESSSHVDRALPSDSKCLWCAGKVGVMG